MRRCSEGRKSVMCEFNDLCGLVLLTAAIGMCEGSLGIACGDD